MLVRHLVAMQWPRLFDGFNRPGGGVMLIVFVKCHGLFDNPASLKIGPSKGGY